MNLERLEEFVTIADTGSIAKAAAELNVSAATLRARCHTFEHTLGFTLFELTRSSAALTKEGALLYKDALQIIKEYKELKKELLSIHEITFSSLTIAVTDFGLPFYLGPFLDHLNTHYPTMELNILDNRDYSIAEGITSEKIDLYFASALEYYQIEGISRLLISHSQPYVLLPSNHRLAAHSTVSIKELAKERFILYPSIKETCIRDFQLENLKAAKIPYTLYEHHTSPRFYDLLVPIQKGIIISPTPFLHTPPNSVALPLTDLKYQAPSFLFYNRNSRKPEIKYFIQAFTKFIAEEKHHDHGKII